MHTLPPRSGKAARTRQRLAASAIGLCEAQGFDDTTVAQIAAAAGVSEMTFFRHFPSKEAAILDDPYDPYIASRIRDQPRTWDPLRRAAEGLRAAWQSLPQPEQVQTRRRIRILAASPALRAASWRNNEQTREIVAQALIDDGVPAVEASVAAAACLAAITVALLAWAADGTRTMDTCVNHALDVLTHGCAP
jgi:AcrR family transcriptional regulator